MNKHPTPEHIPDGDPCSRCGHPFLWHRVRRPTPEYKAERFEARKRYLEERRRKRLVDTKLAHSRLGELIKEYESRPKHVTEAFKRKLFEAWWKTRKAAVAHELATERLVRHLGSGPLTWKGHTYRAEMRQAIELLKDSERDLRSAATGVFE